MVPLRFLLLLLLLLAIAAAPAAGFLLAWPPAPAPARSQCRHAPPALASTAPPSSSSSTEGPSYFEWLGRQIELKLRPKPYEGLRLQVDKDLAVLLMRSSYQVTDDLDFLPMDGFQKAFFFVRQAEWEGTCYA